MFRIKCAKRDGGIRMPTRWRAAPSSTGAGIVDQSGTSMVLFILACILVFSRFSSAVILRLGFFITFISTLTNQDNLMGRSVMPPLREGKEFM